MSSLVMSRPLLFYPSWLPWAVTSWGDLLAATVVAQWLSLSSSCSFLPGILPTSRIIRMEAPGGQGSPASAGIFLGRWSRNSASSGTPTCSLGCRPVHCVMLGMLCNPSCLVVSSSATSACRALEMWNRIFCCSLFLKLNVVVQLLSLVWLYDPMDCSTPRLPCPSPSPRVCSNSCPLSQWCHAAISSSIHPFLLLSISPSIRVFSNELALCIRWPKYGSFSICPCSEYSELLSFRIDWFDLLAVVSGCGSRVQL